MAGRKSLNLGSSSRIITEKAGLPQMQSSFVPDTSSSSRLSSAGPQQLRKSFNSYMLLYVEKYGPNIQLGLSKYFTILETEAGDLVPELRDSKTSPLLLNPNTR